MAGADRGDTDGAAPPGGGRGDARHLDRPFDGAGANARPQHPYRPCLVGTGIALLLPRAGAGAGAGRGLRRPAADTPRAALPQSLRPSGPGDAEASPGTGWAADCHTPRQRTPTVADRKNVV